MDFNDWINDYEKPLDEKYLEHLLLTKAFLENDTSYGSAYHVAWLTMQYEKEFDND